MTESVNEGGTAVVLLSGGQDSTTCLFWALSRGVTRVHCLSVWYGQRHQIELEAARKVVDIARSHFPDVEITHEELNVGAVLRSTSPLVSENPLGKYDRVEDLPGGVEPTFIPGRNVLFLTLAGNRAAEVGAQTIVTGVCQEDFGGYFDCRQEFVDAMERALGQGFVGADHWVDIQTPLMDLTKSQSVELAVSLEGCMDALMWSHTCYSGEFPPCGQCHACHLRGRGFWEAGVMDPLMNRVDR